jgi:localization factor PodJL
LDSARSVICVCLLRVFLKSEWVEEKWVMKPGIPWSVKGIEPDAREAAKLAAKRSGMTLGEWLNSTILDSADDAEPLKTKPRATAAAQPQSSAALERTASRLEDIAEHLARLSQREAQVSHPVTDHRTDSELMSRVLNRVENNERQTVEAFTAVNDRLAVLGRQMAQAAKSRVETRVEESAGYQTLEKAVRNIVEHMEVSEKRSRENFKSLQERVAAMTSKAQAAPQEQVLKQAPAFTQLEQRLAELASRIERSESEQPKQGLPDLLKKELSELAGRIDTVRDTAESLAQRAQTQAVQTSQQELRAIEQRIVGLIREAQTSLSGNGAGPAEMQRLRGEVERLNTRIDEAARGQAQGSDVLALRAAVEQLSSRVAQGPDLAPIVDMDRRIHTLSEQLERTQAQTRGMPQFGEIERKLAELDHKLNEAVLGRSSAAAAEVEDRLNEIAGRVERTEQQLTSLETIERAVNQLFDSLEQQRNWTQQVATDAAEGAANRMAQQILSQGPQAVSLAGAPEIAALQQGLNAVRMASENADQRNQETLEAVHETLEQIVGKLAELETAAIGQRVAQAVQQQPDVQMPPMAAAMPEAPIPSAADIFGTQAASFAPGNNPFEPEGQAAPVAEAVDPFAFTAPQDPMAATLQQGREAMQADQSHAEVVDLIAQARKAAQASYNPRSILSGVSPDLARASEEASSSLLNLNLFKRKAKDNSNAMKRPGPMAGTAATGAELGYPPGFKQPANENTTKRRKLILLGLMLLAGVSVFAFNFAGAKKLAVPVKPAAAIEQPMEEPKAEKPAAATADDNAEVMDKFEEEDVDDGAAGSEKPKPAELESQLETEGDTLTTGSITGVDQNADIGSIIAAGETASSNSLPPSEVGTMALREAAAQGNAQAQFVIATRYLNGEMNVPQDMAKAAYWYGKSAAQGLAPAQYRLGTLYERGKGVARDLEAALGWYERAAGLGNVKAMHNAAVLAASTDGRAPDYARAYKWFALGANHGLKDSQFNLAVLLERGLGTEANPKEALFWYTAASQQNDAEAKRRAEALAKSLGSPETLEIKTRFKKWAAEKAPDKANVVSVSEPTWNAQGANG